MALAWREVGLESEDIEVAEEVEVESEVELLWEGDLPVRKSSKHKKGQVGLNLMLICIAILIKDVTRFCPECSPDIHP